MILRKNSPARVVVISIDGVPYSFVKERIAAGALPNFKKLVATGALRRMRSVQPCVSSVAWASYMTGKNPGKHGIFGFIEKKPGSLETFVPTSVNMTSDTIWEMMSRAGKKVFAMNVPVTFPPRPINGILIGCFLGTRLESIAYPQRVARQLKAMDYKIDAHVAIAHESLDRFADECNRVLVKRAEVMFHYLDSAAWDFFQCHIMETDRMNHFFWEHAEKRASPYGKAFYDFYERLDDLIGEVDRRLGDETALIVLSDHGFCAIKKEIYLNRFLVEAELLKFTTASPKNLLDMHADSLAYSLIPGRIFINRQGREPKGTIAPEQYEWAREKVAQALLALKDPDDGAPIIRQVLKREEVYHGEHLPVAADLIAIPHDGYDLKGNVTKAALSEKTALSGMHTFDDALFFVRRHEIKTAHENLWIGDVAPTILKLMNLTAPADMDGVAIELIK
jgi:predicted AlkP superfamily phosphohydrolase/phosphomutase